MSKTTHTTSIPTNHVVTRRFSYDHNGRLIEIWHKLDALPEVRVAYNKYNELGQLVDKKLHSTDASATNAKQSVDYRYNIRGWLTSLNNSTLTVENSVNDEAGDYFGMNLAYNTDIGISNSALFNGSITGVKWGNISGGNTIAEKAYVYTYDAMTRLTGSAFKEKVSSSWVTPANNAYVETGVTYDLNGNIQGLTRNDKRPSSSGTMDILIYNYGAVGATSNRLLKVGDSGDKAKGFIDGTNTVDDYTYDANGNMSTDQNKGITTPIGYNYLNLPQTISRGQNNITYIYDASGRKLAQRVTFGAITKQTDYIGELVYEGNALQFVNHDEGRAVMAGTELIYTHAGGSTSGLTAYNTVSPLTTITQNSAETYVKATSNGIAARSGIFPIGGAFIVAPGERYKIRMKGYRDKGTAASSSTAHVLIKINGTDLNWPGATLPSGLASAQTESWIEQIITIPAGATLQSLQVGIVWNSVLSGEAIYLNEFEITKLTTLTPEYQYHIKDHLGNVRLTFTTASELDQSLATMETANAAVERSQFLYYDEAVKINSPLFNHTNDASSGGTIGVTGINISPAMLTLAVGKTGQLTNVVVPANASIQTVTWTSNNVAVATVNSTGVVTGVAPGTATITVTTTSGSFTASTAVTIVASSAGSTFYRAINFNGAAVTIDGNSWEASTSAPNFSYTNGNTFANQNITLNPATDLARATMIRSCIWGSSNINVGAVPNGSYAIYVYVWEDNNPTTFSFSIEGTVAQSNYNSGTAGSWAKLGPFIRTVSDGVINLSVNGPEGSLSGIEIWNHNNAAQIDVTGMSISTSNMSLNVGQTGQLATTITPGNATNQNVTWTTSNTAVATVSSGGLVTAVAVGTATITARSVSNTSITTTSTITVNAASTSVVPLVALKFNENSGTSPASTGSLAGITFTATATAPAWSINVPTTVGGVSSLDFGTTTGNYVVESAAAIEGLKNLSAFTLTGWLNCKNSTVGSGGNRIISWINGGGHGVDLVYRNDGSLRLGVNAWPDASPALSSVNKITTNASAPSGNWVFFAVTYQSSNGQVQFYFGNNATDAILDVTRTYSQGVVGSNTARLAVGHFNSVTRSAALDRMFRGLIDDIQIHGSALTPAQIVSVQRNGSGIGTIAVTAVTVAPSAPILTLGSSTTAQLAAAVTPSNSTNSNVSWTSSNTTVATVNSTGLVTALAAGTAIITARSVSNASVTGTSTVTVNAGSQSGAIAVTGLTVSPTNLTLTSGQTSQLTKTIVPANAGNQNVDWISSNTAVATVSSTGLVAAVSTGTAAIISTSLDGGHVATATVTVNASGNTTYYSTRLAGTSTERFGLAKSLSVMPGDVITTEVFVKYLDADRSNWSVALTNFIAAIAGGTAPSGTFVDGGATGSLGGGALPITPIDHSDETGSDPKAYLNYIVFGKNMSSPPLDFGFKRLSVTFREYGQDGPHQRLAFDGAERIEITEPGYVYIYLSNENGTPIEVYFDDFKVTHTKTPIVQQDDYYPFGLTFNSYQREDILTGDIKYNSKEVQNELGINWLDYGARMYMPEIGRWGKVDELSDQYEGVSPYCYALNDPINAIDPDGNLIVFVNGFMKDQWLNQSNGPAYKATPHGLVPDPGKPNPHYRPYPGERTFSTGAPTYLGQPFKYWGNEYNDNAGIGGVFSQIYNDYNTLFISASAGTTSQAEDRFQEGITAANDLIKQLESGDVTLEEDETIKIIGHSQGAAFAAGMVSVLAKHKKYSSRLEVVHYLSPHQPKDFKHAANVLGYQWSTRSDLVSSLWFSPIQSVNGFSTYGRIEGIEKANMMGRFLHPKGFGGHFADTWTFNLVQWANLNGIPVTIYK
jgi:RHS repeat-associated protein